MCLLTTKIDYREANKIKNDGVGLPINFIYKYSAGNAYI